MNDTLKPVESATALIIEDDTLVGLSLKSQLEKLGHKVVGQAGSSAEAHKFFREHSPDLLLVDIQLGREDGITLLGQLAKERPVPAIIVSAYSDRPLIDRAAAAGVFGYLLKPASPESLAAQIHVARERFREREKLRQEKTALTQTLEERKLVERAKGIFMRRLNLTEPEAHKRMQQESQKRRIPIGELARRLIQSEEIMGSV